ncbi:zinc finger protein 184 [Drosophila subobscura]|uniref:zinc finger protein 184 n=1 Tax=Drosophila subobscura TaxID=7241 RepID=UPI00155B2615|nr:zinc finger protein 184 [Drosophila subobscura]
MDEQRPCQLCQDNMAVGIKLESEVIDDSKELLEKLIVWYNINPCILEKKSCLCQPCLDQVLSISATFRRWNAAQPKTDLNETVTVKEESPLEIDGWENIELLPEQNVCFPSGSDAEEELEATDTKKDATVIKPRENFAIAVRHDGLILAKIYKDNTKAARIVCTCCHVELSLVSHIRTHSLMLRPCPKYICRKCDKTFSTTTKLKQHEHAERHHVILSRSKGFDFRCVQCEKVFDGYHGIIRHASFAHLPRPFHCIFSKCTLTFKARADLDLHMKTHEMPVYRPSPLYLCRVPECGQSYYIENQYVKHMKIIHGIQTCLQPGCTEIPGTHCQHVKKGGNPQHGEFVSIETSAQRKRRFSYSPPNDNNMGKFIRLGKQLTLK